MVSFETLRMGLLMLHALAGAAWFGSIFYSIFVLYPKLCRYFGDIAERERFLLALSHGARWHMVAAITLVALSGLGLMLSPRGGAVWLAAVSVKIVLTLASAVLFWRVSWYWWPARLFALETELPTVHRRFRMCAAAMLMLVGANAVLGVMARI